MGPDIKNKAQDAFAELVEEEVIPVRVHLVHKSCGGEFLATGAMNPTEPPQYQHKCSKCGLISNSPQTFPSIGFKAKPLIHTLNS